MIPCVKKYTEDGPRSGEWCRYFHVSGQLLCGEMGTGTIFWFGLPFVGGVYYAYE